MGVQLEVRPCWKWVCPHCTRTFRYPTTVSMQHTGKVQVALHLTEFHGVKDFKTIDPEWNRGWVKDHWSRLVGPCT